MTCGLWDVKCESAAGFSSIRFYLFILNPEQVEMKICSSIHAHMNHSDMKHKQSNVLLLSDICESKNHK